MQSEALTDATLIECAVTKTQDHMLAISRRKTVSEPVTDVLVKRGDRDVLLSMVRNAGARFSRNSFAILVKRAEGDDTLTGCVGRRPDLPAALFERLLEAASEAVRAALQAERKHAPSEIEHAIEHVANAIRSEATTQTQAHAAARVRVQSLNRAGKLNWAKLEEFAKAGRADELAIALALMAQVPDEVVFDIMNEPGRRRPDRAGESDPAALGDDADSHRAGKRGPSRYRAPARPAVATFENLHQPDARDDPRRPTWRATRQRRRIRARAAFALKQKPPRGGDPRRLHRRKTSRISGRTACPWPVLTRRSPA